MNRSEFLTRATEALRAKRFDDFEEVWLAYAETAPQDVNTFTSMAEGLIKRGQKPRTTALLSLLATHLEENGDFVRAVEVTKNALAHTPDDEALRRQLAGAYRRLHAERKNLDAYIDFSGLPRGAPLDGALQTLERCLQFDEGQHFLHEAWGVGRVTQFDPRKQKVVIEFERAPGRELSLENALRFLVRLPADHFLVRRAFKLDELKAEAKTAPALLVGNLLSSLWRELSTRDIRTYLEPVVGEREWPKWWEGTRRLLEKDPNIRATGQAQKTYTFVARSGDVDDETRRQFARGGFEEKLDIIGDLVKARPELCGELLATVAEIANQRAEAQPHLALEALFLAQACRLDLRLFSFQSATLVARDPAAVLSGVRRADVRKSALDAFIDADPVDARAALKEALSGITDLRTWDDVARVLPEKDVAPLCAAADASYLTMPVAYAGCLKRFPPEPGFPALSKMLEVAEKQKSVRGRVKEFLKKGDFGFLKESLKLADSEQRRRFARALGRSYVWIGAERSNIKDFLTGLEPSLVEEKAAPAAKIMVSRAALQKKEEELRRLTESEISKAGKEIARAAAHGDLSENYEYKAAKEKQAKLLTRARLIQEDLKKVEVIRADKVDPNRINVGTRVTLEPAAGGAPLVYDILGPWDSDHEQHVLSYLAPFAQQLLGRAKGDTVELDGVAYRIAEISVSPRL